GFDAKAAHVGGKGAVREVELAARAVARGSDGGLADDRRQAEVDAVAVEDAREAGADEEADPRRAHRLGNMLPRGAAAEVRADDEGGGAYEPVSKRRIESLEEVVGHLLDVGHVEVGARVEHVRVDVVTGDDDGACVQAHAAPAASAMPISAGSTISPATAAAAATQALARYTDDSPDPIRPRKLRLVVVRALSPAARIPPLPPNQA